MVKVKGSTGTLAAADVQSLGVGSANFAREMKPHALVPTNAKELILKDADYSTPNDHYFSYVNRNKGMLDQMKMAELKEDLRS